MIIRRGKIHVWAAGLSVAAHLMLLGGFAAVRLGTSAETVPAPLGAVSLRTDRRWIETPLITPKPQIKPEIQMPPVPPPVENPEQIPVRTESPPVPQQPTVQPTEAGGVMTDNQPPTFEAELFGQEVVARTICFVVDCSGSMYGRLELIRQQLKDCIASLRDTQSFYIILFMNGNILKELGDGKAIPANGSAKSRAFTFIDDIHLEGKTNARQALERAMRIRDAVGRPVELIYFLTDGFELQIDSSQAFSAEISAIRRKIAPSVCINTIGLGISQEDQKTLIQIAEMTGGRYIPK